LEDSSAASAINLWTELIAKFDGVDDIQPFEQFRNGFSPITEDPLK